jgi:hypothetical protein
MENRSVGDRAEEKSGSRQAVIGGYSGQHRFERATELLSDEHRVIERVLAVVDKLTRMPVEGSLEQWKKSIDFIRCFADRCHHL